MAKQVWLKAKKEIQEDTQVAYEVGKSRKRRVFSQGLSQHRLCKMSRCDNGVMVEW